MTRRLILPVLAALAVAGAIEARVQFFRPYIHPKLKSGQVVLRRVVILPAEVQFNRIGMKGPEGMPDAAESLAAGLYSVLATELGERGVEIRPNPVTATTTDETKYATADLQAKYDSLRTQILRKSSDVEQGRFSLTDSVSTFEPGKGADAILLIRGSATLATSGKMAALVIGYGAVSGFTGDMSFIDAHNGDVLAWAKFSRTGDVSQDTGNRLMHCTLEALHDVPLPTPPRK